MTRLSAIGGALRSAAGAAIDRIRRVLPGRLGGATRTGQRGLAVEELGDEDGRTAGGDAGAGARQSTRRRSSTALEDPARFDDGPSGGSDERGGDPESDLPTVPGDGPRVTTGPDPLDGLAERDRPLADPADDAPNGTRTEGERRPDGRFRIVDAENPEAYLESDASVALDHHR